MSATFKVKTKPNYAGTKVCWEVWVVAGMQTYPAARGEAVDQDAAIAAATLAAGDLWDVTQETDHEIEVGE